MVRSGSSDRSAWTPARTMRLSSARKTVIDWPPLLDGPATSVRLLPAVPRAQLNEGIAVHLVGSGDGQLAVGHGTDGGGAHAALQDRPLAVHGAGPVLGHGLAVDLDADDPVEDQEELVARLALGGDRLPLLHVADLGLGRPRHELLRELALEGGLDLGAEGGRVAVAPGAVLAEGPPV